MGSIKGLMIGMVLISFFAIIFSNFYVNLNDSYANTQFNNSKFTTFNKAEELTAQTEEIKDSINPNYDPTLIDILGAYFKAGYNSLYMGFKSLNLFTSMADDISESTESSIGRTPSMLIITIVIILVCFTIISALIKSDKL